MFACALACLTAGSRMLLSLGHDGLLPKVFTHTSRHTHAPDVAIWAVAIPMTVIPVAYIAGGLGRRDPQRRGRHARDLRLHARVRASSPSPRRSTCARSTRTSRSPGCSASSARSRWCSSSTSTGYRRHPERHLPRPGRHLRRAAVRLPRLDRARPRSGTSSSRSASPRSSAPPPPGATRPTRPPPRRRQPTAA